MMDEFYGTVEGYRAYHEARGRDVTDQTDGEIGVGLLVASEWLDGTFRSRWSGYRVASALVQTRDWPRTYVVDAGGFPVDHLTVPSAIEYATYEAAFREIASRGTLTADYTPNKYDQVSIDDALSVKYRHMDAASAQKQFPIIGIILTDFLTGSGSSLSSGMVRV